MNRTALAIASCFWIVGAAFAQTPTPTLFETPSTKPVANIVNRTGVISYTAKLNPAALLGGAAVDLRLPLPKQPVTARLVPMTAGPLALPNGQLAWRGTISDPTGGTVFILKGANWLRGRVERGGKIYVLRSTGNGPLIIDVIDPAKAFGRDHPEGLNLERFHIGAQQKQPTPAPDCADDPNQVDLMVVYTAVARAAAGGHDAMEADVAFAVAQANLAYTNSAVNHRLNLVYSGEVDYPADTSTLSFYTALPNLQSPTDGVLDTVPVLRNTHKADLVSMITENGDACGLGYYNEPPSAGSEPYGYSVVRRDCAGGNFSLAHETGHNLAADHDRDNAGGHISYTYNYGHTQPVPTGGGTPWRTVMSYPNPCGTSASGGYCARIAYFSNPGVSVGSDPAGVALSAPAPEDNVAAINLASPLVSKFRCRASGTTANVWMKDRWEDAGGEPDPNTAGEPMWESPYIWNRTSPDPTLIHQHEHQNPVMGHPNYVYVKIHNDGGAAATGHLELYWADASTNLNDPASWHLIASQAETIVPGTRVIEFLWSSLPGTGHHCMIARWNQTGLPMSFTDVNVAVRNSNDLVWRNMEIVDPPSGDQAIRSFNFLVRGVGRGQKTALVLSTVTVAGKEVPWAKLGLVTMTTDAKLIDSPALRPNLPASPDALTTVGAGKFSYGLAQRPAVLNLVAAERDSAVPVTITFAPDRKLTAKLASTTPHGGVLAVRVIQVRQDAAAALLAGDRRVFSQPGGIIGGMTYLVTIRGKDGRDPNAAPPQ